MHSPEQPRLCSRCSLFSGLYTAAPDARFGTAGVIVRKLPPKETRSGRAFSVWKLQGPNAAAHQQPVTLMLFGNAHNALWQTERGQVLVLLVSTSILTCVLDVAVVHNDAHCRAHRVDLQGSGRLRNCLHQSSLLCFDAASGDCCGSLSARSQAASTRFKGR